MSWIGNHRWLKILVAIVIISTLFLLPLAIARAAALILWVLKEFGLDVAARLFARMVISKISNSIVGKILKAGRNGGPAFIQDWRQFTQSGQYRGEDIFRAMLASAITGTDAQICEYMRTPLKNIFNATTVSGFNPNKYRVDSLQSFGLRNKCSSLPPGFNIEAFRKDFNKGGWEVWGKLIQPQNNFYGVFGDSLNELNKQRRTEEKVDLAEALAGEGNTSKRENCKGKGQNKECTIMGLIITPGTVFSDTEKTIINRELDWLVSADELSEVIAGATYMLLDRLENFVAGQIAPEDEKKLDEEIKKGEPSYDLNRALEGARQDCVSQCIQGIDCSSAETGGTGVVTCKEEREADCQARCSSY